MPVTKAGNVRIDDVRIVFPRIFTPDDNGKYSVGMLLPKDHPDLAVIKTAMQEAAKKKWADKAGARYKACAAKDNLALHDGSTKDTDKYPEYEGMMYLNAYSKAMPTALVKGKVVESGDAFYSGAYANVIVNFWAQDDENRKGINCGLAGIQFLRDGERLGGGKVASADEFEDIDGDDTTVSEFDNDAGLDDPDDDVFG